MARFYAGALAPFQRTGCVKHAQVAQHLHGEHRQHGQQQHAAHARGDAGAAFQRRSVARGGQFLAVADHRFDAQVHQQLARLAVVVGADDPHLRPLAAILPARRVAVPLPAAPVVVGAIGHRRLDAVLGHQGDHRIDVFRARGGIDLAHARSLRERP